MNKKLLLLLASATIFLGACNRGEEKESASVIEETSESKAKDKDLYEIGETANVENFEWEVPYQVTLKSAEITRELGSEDIDDYVGNAPDTAAFVIANVVIKNTSDESYVLGEYIAPLLGRDIKGSGQGFIFELSEDKLSPELAPGEEVELDFVFTADLTNADDEGNFRPPRAHRLGYFQI